MRSIENEREDDADDDEGGLLARRNPDGEDSDEECGDDEADEAEGEEASDENESDDDEADVGEISEEGEGNECEELRSSGSSSDECLLSTVRCGRELV